MEALEIVKVNNLNHISSVVSLYDKVYNKIPKLFRSRVGKTNWEYKISIAPEVKPYSLSSPRRIPLPLMNKGKSELEEMEKLGLSPGFPNPLNDVLQ